MTHPLQRIQQRGATLIVVALGMGMALAAMMALDIGNLVWQKRELQKIADLAALAGAAQGPDGCVSDGAKANAQANGLLVSDVFPDPVWGEWKPGDSEVKSKGVGNACQVSISRTVPYLFMFDSDDESRTLRARAIAATQEPVAMLSVRNRLLSINSQQGALLNAVVGGLLGGSLDVAAVGWQGLANTDVNLLAYLDALNTQLGLNVGTYEELLNTELAIGELLGVMASLVPKDGPTANAAVALASLGVKAKVSPLRVRLGDLLKVQTGASSAALDVSANVLSLVQALVQVGNGNNAAAVQLAVPLRKTFGEGTWKTDSIKVELFLIEKPQWAVGNPYKNIEGITAATSQLKLYVNIPIFISGDLELTVIGAQAKAALKEVSCELNDKWMRVNVEKSALKLNLKLRTNRYSTGTKINLPSNPNAYLSIPPESEPPQQVGLGERFGTTPLKEVNAKLADQDWVSLEGIKLSVAHVLTLVSDAITALAQSQGGLLGGLAELLFGLLKPLVDVVTKLLNLLITPLLDAILNGLLSSLGVDLASADIAGQLTCGNGSAKLVY